MRKFIGITITLLLIMMLMAGCGSDPSGNSDDNLTFKLAHNLNEQHPVHLSLTEFARQIEEKSNGQMKADIFPNAVLGSEQEVLEQLQAGVVDFTKVSAAALTTYSNAYNAFTLPFVFVDKEHYFRCMESEAIQRLYQDTHDQGFIGLTYYDSGARSFYTVDKPILHPDDLRGLKIRVMGLESQINMIKALGGSPIGMPYGDVYTSLQTRVIDGAENNETALTNGRHGEVAKHFSYSEHTMIPDILVISSKLWDALTDEQQEIIKEAAAESTRFHQPVWDKSIEDAKKQAEQEMGVAFYEVNKEPFRQAVVQIIEDYKNIYPEVRKLLEAFEALE